MELTKQDKKRIQDRVNKLSFRLGDEANEYARLYEKAYYDAVIRKCQARIDTIDFYNEQILKAANNET